MPARPKLNSRFQRTFISLISSLIVLTANADEIAPPNIVLIIADDMGVMDTSLPFLTDENNQPIIHPLNKIYRTPALEQLAQHGVRYSQFYANSLCSPSRVSLMTGQSSARHRTTQYIKAEKKNTDPMAPRGWNWAGLHSQSVALPRLLQDNGYRTILVGKGHLGAKHHEGEDPTSIGFDINIAGSSYGRPGSYYAKDKYGAASKKTKGRAVPDLELYYGTEVFLTEAITLETNKAISQAVADNLPFFAVVSHFAPHSPFQPDPRFIRNYKDTTIPPPAKAYASLIEGLDKSVGDVMTHLQTLGVADNTFVIFLGDNGSDAPLGEADSYTSSTPLRGKKGTQYEGSFRVPFVAAWAQHSDNSAVQKAFRIDPGIRSDEFATIMDLFPTLLDLAQIAAPDTHQLDGHSLRASFANIKDNRPQQFLMHFPHENRSNYFTTYRENDWKVVYHYTRKGSERYELFNLSHDPYEKTNLSTQHPDKLKEMLTALQQELEEANALYPVNPNSKEAMTVQF